MNNSNTNCALTSQLLHHERRNNHPIADIMLSELALLSAECARTTSSLGSRGFAHVLLTYKHGTEMTRQNSLLFWCSWILFLIFKSGVFLFVCLFGR